MKYIIKILFVSWLLVQCDKKPEATSTVEQSAVSGDSVLVVMKKNWKFDQIQYPAEAYAVLNNWDNWRIFFQNLQKRPTNSLRAYKEQVKMLLSDVESVESSVPEGFQNPRIFSRINVLKTHLQQLDMYLELNPLPLKDIQSLLPKIDKDIRVVIFQFKEKIEKDKLPKNIQEPVLEYDTIRRANENVFN